MNILLVAKHNNIFINDVKVNGTTQFLTGSTKNQYIYNMVNKRNVSVF